MSELTFTGSHRPLSGEDLRAFERWLERRLPPRYSAFLLRTNGGHPHRHLAPDCYLQGFYAIMQVTARARKYPPSERSKSLSLEYQVESMLDDLPAGIIPIGFAGNGDRVCLSLEDEGIFLWQHDAPYESHPPNLDELMPMAAHIDVLLNKLEGDDPPVPEEEVTKLGRWGDLDLLDAYLSQGHDINEVTSRGESLLKSAAYHGNLNFIKACVQRGATLQHRELLHAAAFTIDHDLMAYLLEQGVSPNERDGRGLTPLDCVLPFAINSPAVKLLRKKGGKSSSS